MTQNLAPLVAEWERAQHVRRKGESAALTRRREEAWRAFLSRGFPTTREEEWRFTSVAPIAERELVLADSHSADGVDVDRFRLPTATAAELVFVNGRYAPALSRSSTLPAGSRVAPLADVLTNGNGAAHEWIAPVDQHPFVALNTAFLTDGASIEIAPGAILEHPIHVLFVATPGVDRRLLMAHPRVVVVAGANSQASVVETYAGVADGEYFTNTVTEIALDENAVLDHYKQQVESAEAYHVGSIHVRARRSASCTSHSLSLGGALVRNDIVAVLDGEGVTCTLNGLYLADAQRLVDHHTTIDHAKPQCGSREMYKGILADHARGVFNGKIIVRRDAQKTDAKQTNRALLLSEDALINTKPQLEIFANDVKCTHGAAVGQLDDEALFYLRSRGLSDAAARQMLIHDFAGEVLNGLRIEALRAGVEDRLQRQLARALPAAA